MFSTIFTKGINFCEVLVRFPDDETLSNWDLANREFFFGPVETRGKNYNMEELLFLKVHPFTDAVFLLKLKSNRKFGIIFESQTSCVY